MKMRIDAHQHFWKYHPTDYSWIDEQMEILKKDFLPGHLQTHLQANGFDGCVAVQARQSEVENHFLLELAKNHNFIRGIVGWLDLKSPDVEATLQTLTENKLVKGLRHVVQDEPDEQFLIRPDFLEGVSQLKHYDLAYDMLVFEYQLPAVAAFLNRLPGQRFILDHMAKPAIKKASFTRWKSLISDIASYPDLYCKVSGLVTEADWTAWEMETFFPYLDVVFDAFGTERVLFGSDWPVCNLAANYQDVYKIIDRYTSTFSEIDREKIFGENAIKAYQLD